MDAGSYANGILLRIDSFGLPWNIPQSIRTRARSVTSRNCEPVTVVAPPRNWMCMGDMVTVRRCARVSSVPMDIAAVEQSFGELLAALGDIVVARTRGEPADAAGGSTAALARRYRRRRRRFAELLGGVDVGALHGGDARAFANMRGSLD